MPMHFDYYRLPTAEEREKWKHIFDTTIDPNMVFIIFYIIFL
jgi:hypothetical protein